MREPSEGEIGNITRGTEDWRTRLLETDTARFALLRSVRRVAVVGIKPADAGGPAYEVPAVMQQAGYDIIPVPVYYPEAMHILGAPVHRTLTTITPPPDMVVLFRRPVDIPAHLDELLAIHPRAVWMQSGIRHDAVAETLARAGIQVVQDACVKIDLALMTDRR